MKRAYLVLALALVAPAAIAAEPLSNGDTAWVLTSTALVLFMTIPGLSLFYGGLVRSRNVLSVLVQCFVITCLVSLLWLLVGYSLAFAAFQLTFAVITPALVVGGFAERMRFSAVLAFSGLWLLLVYVPVCHWVWGGGWLGSMGLLDFAGGTVVHITAGTAALVAALMMGSRRGFPDTPMKPHNMTITVAGAGMLWVGWFGFNGGSALAANGDAAMAIFVTHISASAGAFTWLVAEWLRYGKPSALGAVTGMVAGLGTITPASGFVGPAGALVIGIAAGLLCFLATNFLKRRLRIDDSLDVFPVHGVGGILGTLATGVFASNALGIFSGQQEIDIGSQLAVQAIGVVATLAYTAAVTALILLITDRLVGNRVSAEDEVEGLDLISHNERGYDL